MIDGENFVGDKVDKKINIFVAVFLAFAIGFLVGNRSDDLIAKYGEVIGVKSFGSAQNWRSLDEIYRVIKQDYDGEIDEKVILEGASRGMVSALGDEHTNYLSDRETKTFNEQLSGEIGGGIGAEIGMREGYPTIINPLINNPAQKAGILPRDVILKVNDEDISGQALELVIAKIRGEVGTDVKLTIAREGDTAPRDITVTRAIVDNPSVTYEIKNNIGILYITRFDNKSYNLASKAVYEMKQAKVRGLVVDLRNNTGGYLSSAQDLAGLWLDKQVVVIEKKQGKVVEELKTSAGRTELANFPTIVLINENSASASEILAGALKDYNQATIIGEKSYGKGSVQQLIALPGNGTLKLTVAHWFTPKGKTIDKEGIKPNIVVDLKEDGFKPEVDPQMDRAIAELNKTI